MAGEMDKAKGAVKETYGKVTGNRQTEAEGKADKIKGQVKRQGRPNGFVFHAGASRDSGCRSA